MSCRTVGIAAAYAVAMLPAAALAELQIGSVFQPEYKGAIGQLPGGGEHELVYSEPIYAEEVVLTDSRASTALEFLDKTQLRVGTNSTVRLDKFIYDPGTGDGTALLNFGVGAFRYISGSLGKSQKVQLATPTAVLSIRGTELVIAVAADGTTQVAVLDGEIEVTPCGGKAAVAKMGETATVASECTGVSVALGIAVPEDDTLFADLNSIAPAAAPPEDPAAEEPSEPERSQTASTPSAPEAPEPAPPGTDDEGGGFLSGLGNLGRLGRIGDGFSGLDRDSGDAAGGGGN
ncbi:MAG: FecR domain-containing protein [Dongiaceae bacterium]